MAGLIFVTSISNCRLGYLQPRLYVELEENRKFVKRLSLGFLDSPRRLGLRQFICSFKTNEFEITHHLRRLTGLSLIRSGLESGTICAGGELIWYKADEQFSKVVWSTSACMNEITSASKESRARGNTNAAIIKHHTEPTRFHNDLVQIRMDYRSISLRRQLGTGPRAICLTFSQSFAEIFHHSFSSTSRLRRLCSRCIRRGWDTDGAVVKLVDLIRSHSPNDSSTYVNAVHL
ncbi:hypothetical protein BDV96DRAFT_305877 [Lophiotrema nucula]|uniref:Uncharacterized protein n=1 Tax=Lophiotrema nucula TaxID=690887 RepID=A0A6A5YIR5_9PLEO|nr:hypothetical protein BDV96DRAFT_305877 [Lophiotrema nucula]